MLCQMRAEGAMSDILTLDQEHVKPLDVFIIKDPSWHTHTHTHSRNFVSEDSGEYFTVR